MCSQVLGTTESLPTEQLTTYHQNPRQGDTGTIAESLRTNGQFRPLVVNKGTHTGRPYEVLAGNHTLLAARELDGTQDAFPRLDCYVIDVEEDHARRIVLADNRTSDLATYDNHELVELLTATDDLAGTGWVEDDIELLAGLAEGEPGPGELEAMDDEDTEAGEDARELEEEVGQDIAKVDVLWGEPSHTVTTGDVYELSMPGGEVHILVVADLARGYDKWAKYLDGRVFMPYPDVYMTTSDIAHQEEILLVQPEKYLAGHLLDKHASVHGEESVVKA